MYIYGYILFLCEIDEEWSCSCWIVNDFMIICCCCCCCFGMCCWWINALGILIDGLVMRIVVVVESLVKLCEIVELWWIDVLIFKFCESLSVFSYMTCKHLWEEFWAFERSKFGILGEKGLKPETFWHNWWAFVTPQLLFYYFWLILICLVYFYMKMLNYINISVLLFDIYFII